MKLAQTFRTVAAATAFTFAMTVEALAGGILVVDSGRVLNESEVGKHVARQLETIGKTMGTELKAQSSTLKTTADSLAELKGKTPQQQAELMKSRPDLQQKYANLLQTGQKVEAEKQVKTIELGATERKAKIQVAKQMQEVIDAIALERGADVVLEKSSLIYMSSTVDITDTVISRLNSKVTRITVNRERLPRKTAGQ